MDSSVTLMYLILSSPDFPNMMPVYIINVFNFSITQNIFSCLARQCILEVAFTESTFSKFFLMFIDFSLHCLNMKCIGQL